jgi:hypothetical protein
MQTTQINLKTITFFLALIVISFFCFRNCSDKSKFDVQNSKYEKSNDSLRILEQKAQLKIEAYDRHLKELSAELLVAQNNSQVSETKYYALKNKTVKPKYIENVVDCNDTIQSIYKYAVAKDSLCNIVIINKNEVIQKQDTIIKTNVLEKQEYVGLLSLKDNANKNLQNIIDNNKKKIKQQKLYKNFFKISTIVLSGIVLKTVIIK